MELTLDQALQRGIEAHKAGKAQEADRYYTAILKAQPKHPDANHNMGVLAVGVGKTEQAIPFFKTALEVNSDIAQFWLSYIDALIKLNRFDDAKSIFHQAKGKGIKGDGLDKLEERLGLSKSLPGKEPTKDQLTPLANLYNHSQYQECLDGASRLLLEFPESALLHNLMGASKQGLGRLDEAVEAYQKAISLKPDYADSYYNIGNAFKERGNLNEAIEAYQKAISIKPNYAKAYNNMASSLKDQSKLEEAIKAYQKAISLEPISAEYHYNIGNVFQNQGSHNEAIEAYKKALSITPDFPGALNNLGVTLKNRGNFDEAIEVFEKVLYIEPSFAEAHRHLSSIKKYTSEDHQFKQVKNLLDTKGITDVARCHLNFTLAKMYEDLNELDKAFDHLSIGNSLRRELLNYSVDQDEILFGKLKKTQPKFAELSSVVLEKSDLQIPIFVLGMPRSGTTLVEQIISSHSKVFGAGELNYIKKYGLKLATDVISISKAATLEFRNRYLKDIRNFSNTHKYIVDKMPQNFRFIPLICAAFPEAKIIHVNRDPRATCWSNYRQYFSAKGLGYCYNLNDIVTYYEMYADLMQVWESQYCDRICNLNYESLTIDQENQTRRLITYLGLDWEKDCLLPHKNKRSVTTASQQQIRDPLYTGSSNVWQKFEPFIGGVFDNLVSL